MGKTALDPFAGTNVEPVTAARRAVAVATSDTADLVNVTSAIYVGVTGDVTVLMAGDQADNNPVTFMAVPAGAILQLQVRRIMATGTTATNLVAMWS